MAASDNISPYILEKFVSAGWHGAGEYGYHIIKDNENIGYVERIRWRPNTAYTNNAMAKSSWRWAPNGNREREFNPTRGEDPMEEAYYHKGVTKNRKHAIRAAIGEYERSGHPNPWQE